MSDNCITSFHIQKLAHEILEIRERALHSLIAKLERGYAFDNELARSKELLSRLFDWFLLEPCTCEDLVLRLIKQTLQSKSGQTLLNHYGPNTIKAELEKIKTYLEPQYHNYIDNILRDLNIPDVPPLISNIPLSYRSESTAAPNELVFSQKTSPELKTGLKNTATSSSNSKRPFTSNFTFKWQNLISQDLHVLRSIESSFRNPSDPSELLNSCEFFHDVMLQDFPAEVFLQRPSIILGLIKSCPSSRIVSAIMECLLKLTELLMIRIHHWNDPLMYNHKILNSECLTPSEEDLSDNSERYYMKNLDSKGIHLQRDGYLEGNPISVPEYCFGTMMCLLDYICDKPQVFTEDKMKLNRKQNCLNTALKLSGKLVNLVSLSLPKSMWKSDHDVPESITKLFCVFLCKFGDTLEFYRIELASTDCDPQKGLIHLNLLHISMRFLKKVVPLEMADVLLPTIFKSALANGLINPIVSRLYLNLHNVMLAYTEKFETVVETVHLQTYKNVRDVCNSMSAAVKLLRNYKAIHYSDNIALAKQAILSLQFHKNLSFVKAVVEMCATQTTDNNLAKDVTEIVLVLLSHSVIEIRQEMYELCKKKVVAAVGPKLNVSKEIAPGSHITFILNSEILTEIATNGLTSDNSKVQTSAEAILVYILKCKILVSDEQWQKCMEALIPAFPILLCYTDRATPLGRTLLGIFDPEVGKSLLLTNLDVLKGNIEILFSKDAEDRNEAVSRICWLLSLQENSRDLLPKLNSVHDRILNSACQLRIVYDVNKNRSNQHYYEPSSLKQVLELLKSRNVEPVIRRSALTQMSVMVEDYLLHQTFIDNGGLNLLLNIMKSALTEQNYQDYPDSIIPAVSVLKQLCLCNASVRHELSSNVEVYYLIVRGMFLYSTEDHMKEDCSVVLFLLLFTDFVKGSPTVGNLSLPSLVLEKLKVPFVCHAYERFNSIQEDYADIYTNESYFSALRLHWTLEWFGGINEVLKWEMVDERLVDGFDRKLLLSQYELTLLKNCSLEYCTQKYLMDVQNSTTHLAVFDGIAKLTGCMNLYSVMLKPDRNKYDNFLHQPWEKSFRRFLTVLPSGEADFTLLTSVIKFLSSFAELHKLSNWITTWLKDPKNYLIDLLDDLLTDKKLAQQLLLLVIKCVQQERFGYVSTEETTFTWANVFKTIVATLRLNESDNFYNLGFLDCTLSSLVHVTSASNLNLQKQTIFQLFSGLCELLASFHHGKGSAASESVMGLSITRNVLLVLNHLLAEVQRVNFKDWEACFLTEDVLPVLCQLWYNRDVVLRAAVLQLVAGLCTSARIAIEIVREVVNEKIGVWEAALAMLLDEDEANVVRENAAMVLSNLCSHLKVANGDNKVTVILNLLEDYDFYKRLKSILPHLFLKSTLNGEFPESEESLTFVTPGFVRAITKFICNLMALSSEDVLASLQENELIKLFFRSLSLPPYECKSTKELALYRDILEMDTYICILLNRAIKSDKTCLSAVLHTRDCLTTMISFFNPKIYRTYLPEFIYLRNKLWNEIFALLIALVEKDAQSLHVISNCVGCKEPFLETFCEAIGSQESEELQQTALTSLTSLLNVEASSSEDSIHNMLDTVRTPHNTARTLEPLAFSDRKFDLLERTYFEKTIRVPRNSANPTPEPLFAGAELCKILLHLYQVTILVSDPHTSKKRSSIIAALTTLLGTSKQAKTFASNQGLLEISVRQMRELHVRLGLENVEHMRRATDKKRVSPVLRELEALVGLLTNFMAGEVEVKGRCADLGVADLLHKLWVWFCLRREGVVDVLWLLCTFTVDCVAACQSLVLTSPIAGSGPRRSPSTATLLHAIISLISKEMELISRTHGLTVLQLSLEILQNACMAMECRVNLAKSNLFGCFTRLHPAITKRQKPWDQVELMWLEFLQAFTGYPEGQAAAAKIPEVLELIITLTTSSKVANRKEAIYVLRNVAFYQPNRPRLLMSDEFLNTLYTRLENGSLEERNTIVTILWALAANNQKAKLVLKCAHLDDKLHEILKQYHILSENVDTCDIKRMHFVLNLLRDNER